MFGFYQILNPSSAYFEPKSQASQIILIEVAPYYVIFKIGQHLKLEKSRWQL